MILALDDATWLAIAGIVFTQLAGMVASILAFLKSNANGVAIGVVSDKSDANGTKMDQVHQMSNSRLTAMQQRIEELTALVGHLQGEAVGANTERDRQTIQGHGLGPDPLDMGIRPQQPDPPRSGIN